MERMNHWRTIVATHDEITRLEGIGRALANHITETDTRIELLYQDKAALQDRLKENEEAMLAASQRADAALMALFGSSIPAAQVVDEAKRRTRKPKEAPAPASTEQVSEPETSGTGPTTEPEPAGATANLEPDQPTERHECTICGDVYYSAKSLAEHLLGEHGIGGQDEAATQEAAAQGGETETADTQEGSDPFPDRTFLPLDEPLGNCEICMGYGVIDGELYGAPALIPCTCEAGLKVKGGDITPAACAECNIEDPDCGSCSVPDEQLVASLPPCNNRNCTANDAGSKDICLRLATPNRPGRPCPSHVSDCDHLPTKDRQFLSDGSMFCPRCLKELASAGTGRVTEEPAKEAPATKVKECPHPKALRRDTPEGKVCKVCNQLVEPAAGQGGLFEAA